MRPLQAFAYAVLIVLAYAVFALALVAVYFTPTDSWTIYAVLFLLVPALGGWAIGTRTAVALAAVIELSLCALLIWADHDFFPTSAHEDFALRTVWHVSEAALALLITAVAVRSRRARAHGITAA